MRSNTANLHALLAVVLILNSAPLHAGPMDEELAAVLPPVPTVSALPPGTELLLRLALARNDRDDTLATLQLIERYKLSSLADLIAPLLTSDDLLVRNTALRAAAAIEHPAASAAFTNLIADVEAIHAGDSLTIEAVLIADSASIKGRSTDETIIRAWSARLADAGAPVTLRISACRSLMNVADVDASRSPGSPNEPPLRAPIDPSVRTALLRVFTDSSSPFPLRLAAADAAAVVTPGDDDAPLTTAADAVRAVHPILAARALNRASSPAAIDLLSQLAADVVHPAAQAPAITRLAAIAPDRLTEIAPAALRSPDVAVRFAAARALGQLAPAAAIDPLLAALDDTHPDARAAARASLAQLADRHADSPPAIAAAALTILTADRPAEALNWRALEQAAMLLGELNHSPATAALTSLFDQTRPEPRAAAAIALRHLRAEETAPALTEHLRASYQRTVDGYFGQFSRAPGGNGNAGYERYEAIRAAESAVSIELAQTLAAFGYLPAEPVLLLFLPKDMPREFADAAPPPPPAANPAAPQFGGPPRNPPLTEARAAAIWSLGRLYENNPSAPFTRLLFERANDLNPLATEQVLVRAVSVISIGRINNPASAGALRPIFTAENQGSVVRTAAKWAITHITGQDPGPVPSPTLYDANVFLAPAQ